MTFPESFVASNWLYGNCPCGHSWLHHDVDEYHGDGTDLCCVDGCEQNGCPGRVLPDRRG